MQFTKQIHLPSLGRLGRTCPGRPQRDGCWVLAAFERVASPRVISRDRRTRHVDSNDSATTFKRVTIQTRLSVITIIIIIIIVSQTVLTVQETLPTMPGPTACTTAAHVHTRHTMAFKSVTIYQARKRFCIDSEVRSKGAHSLYHFWASEGQT